MEAESKTKKSKLRMECAAGLVTIAFFSLLYFWLSPMFAINDDIMIESILSGSYLRPYPYSFYFSAELGILISSLYRLLPALPWLGIFYILAAIVCVFSILYVGLINGRTLKEKLLFSLTGGLCFGALGIESLVMMHYTILAAMLGAAGLAGFITVKKAKEFILPIVLFLLTYLVRENVFFLLVPFIGIAFLYLLIKEESGRAWKKLKEYLPWAGAFAILFVVLFLWNRMSLSGTDWENYKEYNAVRTEVYDYLGVNTSEEAMVFYREKGIAPEQIYLVSSYDLSLFGSKEENQAALQAVMNYGTERLAGTGQRLVAAVKSYIYRFLFEKGDRLRNILIVFCYIVLIVVCIRKKSFLKISIPVCLALYRSVAWIYLIFRGRYPDRVLLPLYMMELAVLLPMLLGELFEVGENGADNEQKGAVTVTAIMLLYLSAMFFIGIGNTGKAYDAADRINRTDDMLMAYMAEHPDTFYLLDVYSIVGRTKPALQATGKTFENYLWMGGWMTLHPLYLEKLRTIFECETAYEAFQKDPRTRLVLRDDAGLSKELVEEWLALKIEEVDTVESETTVFRIYQYCK